jgi:uncharacterized protein (TIGR03437 family)
MRLTFSASLISFLITFTAAAATQDRIVRTVDRNQLRTIPGTVHRLAQPTNDRGPAAADLQLDHVMLMIKPSAAQQAELDRLLADQQNPSSPSYRHWLTPEAFADRFGLTANDHAKISAWLKAEGLTVQDSSRGRNWIAFTGSADQVSKALHTSIHTYLVNGEKHFANAGEPAVPEAIADAVAGFLGLNDFRTKPASRSLGSVSIPDYTSSTGDHYLSPADWTTIYDVKPLYTAGIDGTGQSIAIVGQSDILLSDLRSFRSTFGFANMDPKQILYGTDPGFDANAQFEANLDLEWSGAIAQKATIYYVYGQDAITAWAVAVSANYAPVVSISYGGCEFDNPTAAFRTVAQQGNAQGITTLVAAGDFAAAGCEATFGKQVASLGLGVEFPASYPEVTAVGGTVFNEGSGNYWNSRNSSVFGSALSYIPEAAWNESSLNNGILGGGGGASRVFPKPAWQTGSGVPADGARDLPDLAVSAAGHDAYLITYSGLVAVEGTSCAAPSTAGVIALLNQYQVKQGYQKTAGLGNINPQLYRLAAAAPAAFHDTLTGNNTVVCEPGTQNCQTGSFGFNAGPGYDQVTGLGSFDANVLVTSWNTAVSASSLTLNSSASKVTLNDTVTLTATVSATGTPTGTVSFVASEIPLGSAALAPSGGAQTASITFPAWMLGTGQTVVAAQYSGDAGFGGSGATLKIQVTLPTSVNVSAVVPSVAQNPVYAFQSGTEPPTWQADIALTEVAGVPALLTGFTIDGQAQSLAQYFPSGDIPAGGTLQSAIVLRNLPVPAIKVFGFSGTDAGGNQWSRTIPIQFLGTNITISGFNMWAAPLTMLQNPAAPATCPWSQQILLDGAGFEMYIVGLFQGSVDQSSRIPSIFGTTRIAPWGSVQGTLCWTGQNTPSADFMAVQTFDANGNLFTSIANVTFAGPAASAVQLTASPASLTLKPPAVPGFQQPVTLAVGLSDKSQPWTATVYPANETTAWLQLSQYSGTGPATITLTALPAGFEPGAYKATILVQSPNATPEWVSIPVMWVNPGSAQNSGLFPTITSVSNGLSFTPGASPGMLMGVYGAQLANTTQLAPALLDNSLAGVSATVNGWPAPILYMSPTQINIQVPYEAAAGPAVLGINNNGLAGGYMFQIAPSSPGIVSVNGAISPSATAKQGTYATMYVTGTGDVTQGWPTGVQVPKGTPVSALPLPLLPLSVTVGGTPALVQFAGLTPGVVGLIQVNFLVPQSVGPGTQPVVVTVNGVASAPANIAVTQ